MSTKLVLTWFNAAALVVAVSVTEPTVKPAEVITVLAVESAVPSCYCWLVFFSGTR